MLDTSTQIQPQTAICEPPVSVAVTDEAAFGYPRDFQQHQFVYLVISSRAGGLSIGVNLNPTLKCTLNCAYCEVDRTFPARAQQFDLDRMGAELLDTLGAAYGGQLRQNERYATLPAHLLQLKHVALSGDGEPTLAPHFVDALQEVIRIRALGRFPFFKIVLVTNSTQFDQPEVWKAIKMFMPADEIWAKLDGGTQEYVTKVNGPSVSIEKVTRNISMLAQKRPVIIQSLFPALNGEEPTDTEINEYALRLKRLRAEGAQIPLVQIYSAIRPVPRLGCTPVRLKTLFRIAHTVRKVSGLPAEVF
jgi:wyosine [tRNA(Phe)-imidazoG37] synthetase (radical SAM superfamily)